LSDIRHQFLPLGVPIQQYMQNVWDYHSYSIVWFSKYTYIYIYIHVCQFIVNSDVKIFFCHFHATKFLHLTLSSSTWHTVPPLDTQFLHLTLSSSTWHSVPALDTQFLHLTLSSSTWHSVPPLDTQFLLGTQFLHLTLSSYTWHSVPALDIQFLHLALSSCTYKLISLQTLNCTVVNCCTFSFNEYPSHYQMLQIPAVDLKMVLDHILLKFNNYKTKTIQVHINYSKWHA